VSGQGVLGTVAAFDQGVKEWEEAKKNLKKLKDRPGW